MGSSPAGRATRASPWTHSSGCSMSGKLWFRARRPDINVLFTSGYFDVTSLPGGTLPGGAALLKKPFRKIELERRIGELLGNPSA